MLIGQAPGVKEPVLGKPFAWTAGRTLFGWFEEFCRMNEAEVRANLFRRRLSLFPWQNTGRRRPRSRAR